MADARTEASAAEAALAIEQAKQTQMIRDAEIAEENRDNVINEMKVA